MVDFPKTPVLLVVICALLYQTWNSRRKKLVGIALEVAAKYGGDDGVINKAEFEKFVKDQRYTVPQDSVAALFVENDNGDTVLNVEELSHILTHIADEFDVVPPAVSAQLIEDTGRVSWLEKLWMVVLAFILIYTCHHRMKISGWERLAKIVQSYVDAMHDSEHVNQIIEDGVKLKKGFKAKIFTDANASRVFQMKQRLDKENNTLAEGNVNRASVWECIEIGRTQKRFVVKRYAMPNTGKKKLMEEATWGEIRAELLPVTEDLEHENIVEYDKDFCLQHEHDGIIEIYILMEFLDGMALHDIIDGRRCCSAYGENRALKESETRHILKDVASALMYLHERDRPIFHLDLNACNIRVNTKKHSKDLNKALVDGDMGKIALQVKLIDFGCATKKSEATKRAGQGPQRSLTHLAPEQQFNREQIGEATEVFLFGELLYTCLLACPPFGYYEDISSSEARDYAFKERLRRGEFNRPVEENFRRWDDLSSEARALLQKCLNAAPKERPQSIREVLEDPWWKMTSDPSGRASSANAEPRRLPPPMIPLAGLG